MIYIDFFKVMMKIVDNFIVDVFLYSRNCKKGLPQLKTYMQAESKMQYVIVTDELVVNQEFGRHISLKDDVIATIPTEAI